jgi:ADP-ribose pyrophosphatase YjhB (NUDIX family)
MKPKTKLFHRVAAIVVRGGHVLTHESEDDHGVTYQALPGGHLEPDETATECLVREMREEFDVELVVDHLAFVAEGFFTRGPRRLHEVVFYFAAHLAAPDVEVRSREKHIRARWLAIDGGLSTLLPKWIRGELPALAVPGAKRPIEYVVARE